jgi:rare lipoprotein A
VRPLHWYISLPLLAVSLLAGCASEQPLLTAAISPSPTVPSISGVASWYGPGFDGHRTSSGATYNQEDLTAASVLFPLGTTLRVTNLDNQRSVEVLVNDHGPYVRGRELDLSHRAALLLGMVGPGTAPVRMDVLTTPAGGPPTGERYFVQVGSFADLANAQQVAARLARAYSNVRVVQVALGETRYYRVRLGAFMDRDAAVRRALLISSNGYKPIIIAE